MREYPIFSCKDAIIDTFSLEMVNVYVDSRQPLEVINFSDAFRTLETFAHALSVTHGRSELVFIMGYDVVTNAVQIVCCRERWCLRAPWIRRRSVLFVL